MVILCYFVLLSILISVLSINEIPDGCSCASSTPKYDTFIIRRDCQVFDCNCPCDLTKGQCDIGCCCDLDVKE